jgi:hypothetical protein
MNSRRLAPIVTALLLAAAGCSSSSKPGTSTTGAGGAAGVGGATGAGGVSMTGAGGATGAGGMSMADAGGMSMTGGDAGMGGAGGAGGPTYDQVKAWVDAYKAAHPGNGGKDWDINAKTPAQVAADPAAQQLLAICGPGQRPVIPLLAWEYGGSDHQWINPQASALVYCVYIPANPSTAHWQYDSAADHVTADVHVRFPDQNPCNAQQGANQVAACIGDLTNFEILVDTASLNDGADVGLMLANSSTELLLILADGTRIHLYSNV